MADHEEKEQKYNDEIQNSELRDYIKDHLPYGFLQDILESAQENMKNDKEYALLLSQVIKEETNV